MMDGRDFRTLASSIMTNDKVLFQDAEGNFHEIYSAYRTRTKEDGARVVLVEPAVIEKQWPLRLEIPPKELSDYLNELYEKQKKK